MSREITVTITKTINSCNECPNLLRARLHDYCNIADHVLEDTVGDVISIPDWCPCLEPSFYVIHSEGNGYQLRLINKEENGEDELLFESKDIQIMVEYIHSNIVVSQINICSNRIAKRLRELGHKC